MSTTETKPCVVLGVTGGIAAYKALEVLRGLQKSGVDVYVIMTKNACEFIQPLSFETLSGHPVAKDTFERPATWEVEHIALAKRADVFAVVPATANIIAKYANGIADDMLSTTILATRAPVLIAPAMNTGMYENAATQANMATLRTRGVHFVEPVSGHLACGDTGNGKLADVETIVNACLALLTPQQDLLGKRVLITAGPTREMLDPVRYISNRSSGKMGYALADCAARRGAEVTLLSGPVSLSAPENVNVLSFTSTLDLYNLVTTLAPECDVLIQAAAPADYRPAEVAEQKIKKQNGEPMTLHLIENPDIARAAGEKKRPEQIFVGFAAETEHVLEHAQEKLSKKNLDMIVANDVTKPGAGFDVDTNIVTMITKTGSVSLPQLSKHDTADKILDEILKL